MGPFSIDSRKPLVDTKDAYSETTLIWIGYELLGGVVISQRLPQPVDLIDRKGLGLYDGMKSNDSARAHEMTVVEKVRANAFLSVIAIYKQQIHVVAFQHFLHPLSEFARLRISR